jgi:hypothetical protein
MFIIVQRQMESRKLCKTNEWLFCLAFSKGIGRVWGKKKKT